MKIEFFPLPIMNKGTKKYSQGINIMVATSSLLLLYLIAMLVILKFFSKVCCMMYIFQWGGMGGLIPLCIAFQKGLKYFFGREGTVEWNSTLPSKEKTVCMRTCLV